MIKILVDSASDINLKEAQELGIDLISMTINFDDEEFLDGVDLTNKEFFEKLIESDTMPKTSQINQIAFEEKFEELTSDGSEVIAIILSSKLSNTYDNAQKASEKFKGKVSVIDSLQACIGERILCNYAMKLVKENKLSFQEITEELNTERHKIKLLAVLGTLEYLKKGGRISSVVAFAGELLSIKPVITLENGQVKLIGKAMGSKKGNNLLNQLVEKCGGINFDKPYALGFSGLNDNFLQKYLVDSKNLWEDKVEQNNIPSFMIGSTIGTHIGPDAIAVAFFAK